MLHIPAPKSTAMRPNSMTEVPMSVSVRQSRWSLPRSAASGAGCFPATACRLPRARSLAALLLPPLFAAAAGGVAWAQSQPQAQVREARPSAVEQPAPGELKQLSIDELMDIDVTSVSKRPEKLSTAAAAISVITADDIRRSGVLTVADALRLAAGLQVAQANGNTWAITARGFNNTAADKMLVLIDGRSVYTPLFAGVFWDVQQTLLADIDRIEVIRGPGAALWGANAVNGVINVITKDAAETEGGLALAGAGAALPGFGGVRYGGNLGGDVAYRVYGTVLASGSLAFGSGAAADDQLRIGQGGFRMDGALSPADSFGLQGDVYSGSAGQATGGDQDLSGFNLLGRWLRRFSATSDLRLQLYVDETHRRVPAIFEESRTTFDLDLQHHWKAGAAHDVVWGVGYRTSRDSVADSPTLSWVPDRRTLDLVNLFAQDEIALRDRLHLTVGSKLEYNTFTHYEFEPSVRLAWTPSDRRTLWAAFSRAVRIPAQIDEDIRATPGSVLVLQGSHDFLSEELLAYELGYRLQPRNGLSLDLAGFYNRYDRLRSEEPAPGGGLPITLANLLHGSTFGGEATVHYQMTSWWRWTGSYTTVHKDLRLGAGSHDPTGGAPEGDDPTYQASLRASLDLPRQVELDGWLRRVDSLPAPVVPAYTEADLRLGWRPAAKLELSLVGRNLLHAHHPEFGAPSPLREEVRRTIYGKVEWHF
jgi:iron complex outermembrane receptor protein